jgi:hypothetical protein
MVTGMYAIYQTILLLLIQNNKSFCNSKQQIVFESIQSKQNYILFIKPIFDTNPTQTQSTMLIQNKQNRF